MFSRSAAVSAAVFWIQNGSPWPAATYACCAARSSNTSRPAENAAESNALKACESLRARASLLHTRYAATPQTDTTNAASARRTARFFMQPPENGDVGRYYSKVVDRRHHQSDLRRGRGSLGSRETRITARI